MDTVETQYRTKSWPAAASRLEQRAGRLIGWREAVAIVCLAFLTFVMGAAVMQFGVFPAPALDSAFRGGAALYDQLTSYRDPLGTDFWYPARTGARGVVRHDPARAQEGLTLYTSGHANKAFLIDMSGRVLHEWSLPLSRVWGSPAVSCAARDDFTYIENARIFPNGDLLALYVGQGVTPWGCGLVKMDRDSHVLWKYLAHTHHDFTVTADGSIYVLTQEISESDLPLPAGLPQPRKPRIDDFVVKLSPNGVEEEKMSVGEVLAVSPYGRRIIFSPADWLATGDYLHSNSIYVLERPVPGIPESRKGQVLVSIRDINTLALFDLAAKRVVWVQSGPWARQHSARFLPNGHGILFDNAGIGENASRVIEFDPVTSGIVWSYGGRKDQPLNSRNRSSAARLQNGNTLIVESEAGRVIEVTPSGDIVWEFVNPVRGGPTENLIPIIMWVQRLDPRHDLTDDFKRILAHDG